MELLKTVVPNNKVTVIAPLGDIQWTGLNGHTALGHLKAHIARCLELDAWFVGMGDYVDFASPSNRERLRSAALYDTAQDQITGMAKGKVVELFREALAPTKGRWLGILHGHHYLDYADGSTTDTDLAKMLGCEYLGTSTLIRVYNKKIDATFYAHHGCGGGCTIAAPLNKLERTAGHWEDVDGFLMGHTTKLSSAKGSHPYPDWNKMKLEHRDILLVNTGGFSKSNIVGNRRQGIPSGDYAEVGMMMPSPLSAPIIRIYQEEEQRITCEL